MELNNYITFIAKMQDLIEFAEMTSEDGDIIKEVITGNLIELKEIAIKNF